MGKTRSNDIDTDRFCLDCAKTNTLEIYTLNSFQDTLIPRTNSTDSVLEQGIILMKLTNSKKY